jgi:hypothetical protein
MDGRAVTGAESRGRLEGAATRKFVLKKSQLPGSRPSGSWIVNLSVATSVPRVVVVAPNLSIILDGLRTAGQSRSSGRPD